MDDYLDLITYLAFEVSLNYENKRNLTIEQLINYRIVICDLYRKYNLTKFKEPAFMTRLNDFFNFVDSLTLENEVEYYTSFIERYNDIFSYKEGEIILNNNITPSDLEDLKFDIIDTSDEYDQVICGNFIGIYDTFDCLEVLGAVKMKNFLERIIEEEILVENAYYELNSNNISNYIIELSKRVDFKMAMIGNTSDVKLSCYSRIFENMHIFATNFNSLSLVSDEMFEEDEFFDKNYRLLDSLLKNKYQRAIFTNDTLVYDKLNEVFSLVWACRSDAINKEEYLLEEVDSIELEAYSALVEDEEYFEEEDLSKYFDNDSSMEISCVDNLLYKEKINKIFYINYIKTIDYYQEAFAIDNKLETSRKRLIYLLDDKDEYLLKKGNDFIVSDEILREPVNKEDFEEFYMISKVFLTDILNDWINDENTLRKLLFVLTYCNLTKDLRIKKLFEEHKNNEFIKNIAFQYFNKNDTRQKRKTKKPKDDN